MIRKLLQLSSTSDENWVQHTADLLQKPEKSKLDIEYLMKTFAGLKFFEEQRDKLTSYLYFQLFSHLEYLKLESLQPVFQFQEQASTFYIILRGRVEVLVPKPNISEDLLACNISIEQLNFKILVNSQKKYRDIDEYIACVYQDFVSVRSLTAGDSFGEIALITKQRRTATIICTEQTQFMVLQRNTFDRVLSSLLQVEMRKLVHFFQTIDYFKNIPENHLTALVHQSIEIRPKLNEVLYKQGEKPQTVYFIRQGQVELSQLNDKQKIVVALLQAGSIFGEAEVLQNQRRKFRASCKSTETIISTMSAQQFEHILHTYEQFDACLDLNEVQTKRREQQVSQRRKATETLFSTSPGSRRVSMNNPEIQRFHSMLRIQTQPTTKYIPITNQNCLIPIEVPKYVQIRDKRQNGINNIASSRQSLRNILLSDKVITSNRLICKYDEPSPILLRNSKNQTSLRLIEPESSSKKYIPSSSGRFLDSKSVLQLSKVQEEPLNIHMAQLRKMKHFKHG